ncbi:hypothetical protein [Thalassotalea eurytherma]|uniref:Uncharacterized protein n=1 Tax=Thalassotalea eurytherma TaxID=1144278 RepID=A0ABQ6H595_9GAMM|nr:hypothetical protein [Thalassotalea eurytherma]GLX82340.1 hypothetical protein theurythT_17920 [Thalassotalea eurytherma]
MPMPVEQRKSIKQYVSYLLLVTTILLLFPLIAMQFTTQVQWALNDFIVMAVMIFCLGSGYIGLAYYLPKKKWLFLCLTVLLFLWIWAELAVGVFTDLGT